MINKSDNVDVGLLSDQEVVKAILNRNKTITYEYLYKKCYPLFKSIYNKYYTDCENCIELINDIYVTSFQKEKVSGFVVQCNLLPPIYPMGIDYNITLSRLSENLL